MDFQKDIAICIKAYSENEQPIVRFRYHKLKAMSGYFWANSYPPRCSLRELSLVLGYFQEAIYDGIDWYEQNTHLQHLETELELDCMFQNNGKMRHELSSEEFEEYIDYTSKAMNGRDPKLKP